MSASVCPACRHLARLARRVPCRIGYVRRGQGTLYTTTGQRQQARTALATAVALYRAMEMTFWLPQAEAALAEVEEQ